MVLWAAVDDATGEVFLRFAASESTEEMMGFLIDYVKRKGRPVAIYADRSSIFTTTRQATIEEQLDGKEAQTQVGRALQELGIEYIAAHSPQAKGRVERLFGVMQDRLVKEMRLAGIEDIEQANEFVEGYMERCNGRFAVKPASEADLHRSAEGYELEAILSVQETRVVSEDLTVSYKGGRWQIDKATAPARIKGRTVTVEQRVDGEVKMRIGDRYLQIRKIQEPAERQAKAKRRPKRKKDKIVLPPGEDHPWRGSYKKGRQPAAAAGAPAPSRGAGAVKPSSFHLPSIRTFIFALTFASFALTASKGTAILQRPVDRERGILLRPASFPMRLGIVLVNVYAVVEGGCLSWLLIRG